MEELVELVSKFQFLSVFQIILLYQRSGSCNGTVVAVTPKVLLVEGSSWQSSAALVQSLATMGGPLRGPPSVIINDYSSITDCYGVGSDTEPRTAAQPRRARTWLAKPRLAKFLHSAQGVSQSSPIQQFT